jgi:TolB-like protein/DNA-binding SARP family transcriptional activator
MRASSDEGTSGRLRLVGAFRLTAPSGAPVEISSRRARGLLAYLAIAPEHTATRERLCGLLWSDRGEAQARASLRQCLLELRGLLTVARFDLLAVDRESISLRATDLVVDLAEIEQALEADPETLCECLEGLEDRRLLEDLEISGLFEDWREVASARLERSISIAVETNLRGLADRADWSRARRLGELYLRRDPLDEMVTAAVIKANIALGASGAARRLYRTLEAALSRELNVQPGAAVREALAFRPAPDLGGATPGERPRAEGGADSGAPMAVKRAALPLPDRPSIAVLPFKNLSGDPDQEYFADAVTEDIVAALSRWRWFFVIARDSSFVYKNANVEAHRVGRELGVRYLVEGSVRKVGARVRISARLIDASDGSHVWADRFDRDVLDVFALQDEITERVAASIEPAMLRVEGLRVARKTPADFGALDYFYRGMWHLHNMTEQSDLEALALFREVVRREPDLPLGYVGLSRILYGRAVFGSSPDPVALLREARTAAETAIGLDPGDAHGYYARAAASIYLHDHGAALTDARRAVDINPNFALAHVRLGQVLVFSGDSREAIEPIERGLRLSPYDPQLSVNMNLLALALFQARRYDQAIAQATAAMNHDGDRVSLILAASLAMAGRLEEARLVLPEPGPSSPYRPMAPAYAHDKDRDHLRQALRRARAAAA